ncbi:jg8395 [Pararge aegeria aegeria]|uniref:Jg8395 protein n=1 Tax=Pararge aegeria aegeria TaxID=348720 RepID=A0A8S4SPQ7_9NEOP|nr:jg8395 [Pararge aegeria aegeria]
MWSPPIRTGPPLSPSHCGGDPGRTRYPLPRLLGINSTCSGKLNTMLPLKLARESLRNIREEIWWEASSVASYHPTDKDVPLSDFAFQYDAA